MRRWLDARGGDLARPGMVALLVGGLVVATIVSDLTGAEGPLGPAGLFFTAVLVVTALGGTLAGLLVTAVGAALISTRFADQSDTADVVAYLVVSVGLTLILDRLTSARERTRNALAQVESMVRHAPVGMAFVDHDRRFVEINETLAAFNRRTVADMLGRRVDELPDMPGEIGAHIDEVLRTGVSMLEIPFVASDVRAAAGYYPVRGPDGSISGVGILVREVSAEHQRDLLFDRVRRLQELTASLSVAGTISDVAQIGVRSLQHGTDARGAVFGRIEGDTVRVEGSIGFDEGVVDEFSSFSMDDDVPLAEAIRSGEPVLLGSLDEATARYPELTAVLHAVEARALAALPLRGESGVLGAIALTFDHEHTFTDDEVAFLVAAATQCATAYERARAFDAERDARRAAQAANRRLEYLSEATKILAQSLDPETTMQRLAELAVPTLAEWCTVHIVEGDHARPMAMASENPDVTAFVRDLSDRHPVPIAAPAGLGAVVRTGRPIVLRSVTMDAVKSSTDESEVVDLLSRVQSIAIVPMAFHGQVVGTVTLANHSDRELADADVALAQELASRAAQAITNAQLFQERTRVAATLQASLLPPSHPIIPGVEVASRFVPAAEGLDVGGDFYDVFRLGTVDDPAPTWAFVIGDVRGKGADAAAITGIARATIRAAALDERSPAQMLARLNQVLLAAALDDRFATETGEPRFCTACVITVTPTPEGADLDVAVGGHPLPYVLRADGTVEQIGRHGGLIGVMPSPAIVDVPATLGAGDALILYTDGITERHDGRDFFDEEGLARVLADCVGFTASETAVRVEVAARGFVDAVPRDDIAVVVARIPDTTAGRVARHHLPDDEQAPAVARRFVAETLRRLGTEEAIPTAELLSSELVANALLHGAPPMHIEVLDVPGGLRIAVTDAHPGLPTIRTTTHDDERGRGLLLVASLAKEWGVDSRPPGKSVWFELGIS